MKQRWFLTSGEKYQARPGFKHRAWGTLFLPSTTELSNHMSISLRLYHHIPVHSNSYICLWDRLVHYNKTVIRLLSPAERGTIVYALSIPPSVHQFVPLFLWIFSSYLLYWCSICQSLWSCCIVNHCELELKRKVIKSLKKYQTW